MRRASLGKFKVSSQLNSNVLRILLVVPTTAPVFDEDLATHPRQMLSSGLMAKPGISWIMS
jgi:hypothetical protein